MSDLQPLRERIDEIDTQLLGLLNERADVALQIGAVKQKEGLPVYAPEREEALLRSLEARNRGPLTARSIRAIYREIMSASLSLEKDLVIACPGEYGSLAHQAAITKFGSSVEFAFFPDVPQVFEAVEKCQADCGVVLVESLDHGASAKTLDALAVSELAICAEIRIGGSDGGRGPGNRFFVIGRHPTPPSGNDRTFLLLRIEDKPGALVAALEPFVKREINLNQFASRPASGGSKDLIFFVEAAGHLRDLMSNDLPRELSMRCRAVRVLGSFPSLEAA